MTFKREAKALQQAELFLAQKLTKGPRPVRELQREARADGISERTLDRAKRALGAIARKEKSGWTWLLPN
jgi:hypothetical protein